MHDLRITRLVCARYIAAALIFIATSSSQCFGATGHAGGHGENPEPVGEAIDEADARTHGVELGDFRIRSYYPVQARKSIVRFVLYATAWEGHFAETKALAESRRHKIRDQVITSTRLVPLAEFDEPDLKSFRRRILLRLRRTLPELAIKDIYISEFELKVKSL